MSKITKGLLRFFVALGYWKQTVQSRWQKYRTRREVERKAKMYRAGYEWAWEMLKSGQKPSEVEVYYRNPFDYNEFDRGAEAGADAYIHEHDINDDRVKYG